MCEADFCCDEGQYLADKYFEEKEKIARTKHRSRTEVETLKARVNEQRKEISRLIQENSELKMRISQTK